MGNGKKNSSTIGEKEIPAGDISARRRKKPYYIRQDSIGFDLDHRISQDLITDMESTRVQQTTRIDIRKPDGIFLHKKKKVTIKINHK